MVYLAHNAYFSLCVSSSWNNISHGFTDIVFTRRTIILVNNTAVVHHIVFNYSDLMLLVFQTMLNLHLIFVNVANFLIRLLVDFSFDSENDSRRIISFFSSNNHSLIIKSSLSLLKYSKAFRVCRVLFNGQFCIQVIRI